MKHLTAMAAIYFAVTILVACNIAKDKKSNSEAVLDTQLSEVTVTTDDLQQLPIPTPQSPLQQIRPTDSTVSSVPVLNQFIDWDKKIIKTGTIKFEVTKFDAFNQEVRNKIKKYGAYVGQEDNLQHDDRREISMHIKVPVAQFDGLMNDLGTADSKQVERTIRAEDVTEEVVDTKSRLEAKKEMRLKYLEFLKQSKNMKEVLEVQAEINSIQEEIESAAGRIQYLSKNAAYSTIQLSFYEPMQGFKSTPGDNSFFQKTGKAFSWGADLIKGFILVLVSIWPLILIAAVGWVFWKRKKLQVPVSIKP
jgi:hypothetical protein